MNDRFVFGVSITVAALGLAGFAWSYLAKPLHRLWSQFDNPDTTELADRGFAVGSTVTLADGRHGTITAIWPDDDEFQVMLADGKLLILDIDEARE